MRYELLIETRGGRVSVNIIVTIITITMNVESKILKHIEEERYNMLIPWVLILSYGYYIRYDNLIPDTTYDLMMKTLLDHFDEVEHQHKHLITKEDLSAGTLYSLGVDDYPSIVKGAWFNIKDELEVSGVSKKKRGR